MKSRVILAVLWTILVIGLSAMPGATVREFSIMDFAGIDKIGHMVIYGILTYLWSIVLIRKIEKKIYWLPAFGFSVILGILMEYCQAYFFSERSFEVADMIANTVGAFICVAYLWFFEKKMANKQSI